MTDTKIAQIDDRGATLAWSPLKSNPDVVAVGAKVRKWILGLIT